jgi:hypothetical protein
MDGGAAKNDLLMQLQVRAGAGWGERRAGAACMGGIITCAARQSTLCEIRCCRGIRRLTRNASKPQFVLR